MLDLAAKAGVKLWLCGHYHGNCIATSKARASAAPRFEHVEADLALGQCEPCERWVAVSHCVGQTEAARDTEVSRKRKAKSYSTKGESPER